MRDGSPSRRLALEAHQIWLTLSRDTSLWVKKYPKARGHGCRGRKAGRLIVRNLSFNASETLGVRWVGGAKADWFDGWRFVTLGMRSFGLSWASWWDRLTWFDLIELAGYSFQQCMASVRCFFLLRELGSVSVKSQLRSPAGSGLAEAGVRFRKRPCLPFAGYLAANLSGSVVALWLCPCNTQFSKLLMQGKRLQTLGLDFLAHLVDFAWGMFGPRFRLSQNSARPVPPATKEAPTEGWKGKRAALPQEYSAHLRIREERRGRGRRSVNCTLPQANMEAPRTALEDLVPFTEAFSEFPC